MKEPNYIISIDEGNLKPVGDTPRKRLIRRITYTTIALLIITSIVLQYNFIAEFSISTKILLVGCIVNLFNLRVKKEWVPSPMEIQFFDEYLIIYKPKRYYSEKVTRLEIDKMPYNRITRCLYKKRSKRVHIYGDVDAKWWDYAKNGNLPKSPTYDRIVKDTFQYFDTHFMDVENLIKEVETHSPLTFEIEDS